MTLLDTSYVACSVCGGESPQQHLTSSNAYGSPDLDLRPPEMARSTIDMWVQRCPECGYCMSSISDEVAGAHKFVRTHEYSTQLNSSEFPWLANSFLCCSMLLGLANRHSASAWSAIHAAWACDDAIAAESARRARIQSLEIIRASEKYDGFIPDDLETEILITIDLMRRAALFDRVEQTILHRGHDISTPIAAEILKFQKQLIERRDIGCHRVSEATGDE